MNIDSILYKETQKAYKNGEIPVGCVIVKNGKVIAKAHNTKQKTHNCINHAEIIAIIKAEKKLKDWRLNDCTMYVSLEPCKMCKEVIRQSRISNVYYYVESKFNNEDQKVINYNKIIDNNSELYQKLLKNFFERKR